MLKKLIIEQFVIIDRLELDFHAGLTVLTGETGAGKSILLDAMGLVLGDPSSPSAIRQDAEQSTIEAIFASPSSSPVWQVLAKNKLAETGDREFVIHRRISRGKDEILVNGKPAALPILKEIGTFLCEIHGQFANQSLLDPTNQLNLLDMSGNFPPDVFKNVSDSLKAVNRLKREWEEEKEFYNKNVGDLKALEAVLAKFNKIGMREGFIEDVQSEYGRLVTARDTSEAFQAITAQLIAANGAIQALSSCNQVLARQQNLDAAKIEKLKEFLAGSLKNARSALAEVMKMVPEYDIDTKPLYQYEEVLEILKGIAEVAEIPFDDLTRYYDLLSAKVSRIRNGRAQIAKIDETLQKAQRAYRHHAHILSEKRVIAAEALSEAITSGLPPLKLQRAQFQVEVIENTNNPWTEKGLDQVTFTARMNPGQPFSPIADTASGGELARLILALKVVLQSVQTIPTLVFDEVDTGIGGSAAAAVGERIAQLAEATQVLVITHSPQVASRGEQHLHVSKKSDGFSTTSVVRHLTIDERTDEISRMLAGDTITAESHAAAKRLIEEAKDASVVRRQGAPAPASNEAVSA